ncbi:MAG: DUF5700 domain-containing putative Zn-dependent protease [Terracidiphilus sp.]
MRGYLLFCVFLGGFYSSIAPGQSSPAIQLSLDTSEAEQALHILQKANAHQEVTPGDWQQLFSTVPYQWLKEREASMGRAFTDEDFQKFLLSPESLARQQEWEQTLAEMKQANMPAIGAGVLEWLPEGATIHARVFPEIKPKHNSFVWTEPGNGPAIFLYMERQSKAQFENIVAHECHHIGLRSLEERQKAIQAGLPENVKTAVNWMSAFGEGEAVLAAAGSVDRHPRWEEDALARARWDSDMMHFNADLEAVQQMLTEILDGTLKGAEAIGKRAAPFWGYQGAWYTVGYEMAALVEKAYGRQAFNECLLDPRKLLTLYNKAALEANAKGASLATWSPDFLARLDGKR